MTIEKALQRLSWRFSEPKAFTPNANDAEAVNTLVEMYENVKQDAFDTNQGFAKLFVFAFDFFLEKYDADVFDEIPQKALAKALDRPIEEYFRRFTENLNNSAKYVNIEKLAELKHPGLMSEEDREERLEKTRQAIEKDPSIIQGITGEAWKQEDVEDILKSMIATAIMRFKL